MINNFGIGILFKVLEMGRKFLVFLNEEVVFFCVSIRVMGR